MCFTKKCKVIFFLFQALRKLFKNCGDIDTVRIRSVVSYSKLFSLLSLIFQVPSKSNLPRKAATIKLAKFFAFFYFCVQTKFQRESALCKRLCHVQTGEQHRGGAEKVFLPKRGTSF
jgi:hypothetical protein